MRVRVGGGWGFAATRDVSRAGAEAALAPRPRHRRGAARRARRDRSRPSRPRAGTGPRRGRSTRSRWRSRTSSACWSPPRPRCAPTATRGSCAPWRRPAPARERKALATTEGAACTQEAVSCGGGLMALRGRRRRGPGAVVPARPRRRRPRRRAGSTCARSTSPGAAPRVAEEAVALLSAPVLPAGVRTVVLHGEQVALQVHESIGHALELDRILLGEASYAGTSWVSPDDLARRPRRRGAALRLRAAHDHRRRDAARAAWAPSAGTTRASPRSRTTLIDAGALRAALSDRESAAAIGLGASGGCARADGFARQPIVRMTNVSLEPGARRDARGPHRRHGRRGLLRDEPLLVDRRPPAAVPVRAPRSGARSAAASSGGCTATRPTPG